MIDQGPMKFNLNPGGDRDPGVMSDKEKLILLFCILDDIDTASDMFKDNYKGYQEFVMKQVERRWEAGISTDGYTLKV